MNLRSTLATLGVAAALVFAPRAEAQVAAMVEGPTVAASTAGFQYAPAARAAEVQNQAMAQAALSRGERLMIFGGAVLLAGAVIGDDPGTIIMISGAVIGLYGLYVYLDRPAANANPTLNVGYSITM